MLPSILSAWMALVSPPGELAALEARDRSLPEAWSVERCKAVSMIRADLLQLLDADRFVTAEALRRAAFLSHPSVEYFTACRQHYELLLAAVALGDEPAARYIDRAWDGLVTATGRRPRVSKGQVPGYAEGHVAAPTAQVVRTVMAKPLACRDRAAFLPSHSQLKRMWEADQICRNQDWKTMAPVQREASVWATWRRRKALRRLLDRVALLNAADMIRAAQVMQLGNWYEDNALAHELAVCAMLLAPGADQGLLAQTYDRLLWTMGQPQRLGTQRQNSGEPVITDSSGFNDTLRKAFGQLPRARE